MKARTVCLRTITCEATTSNIATAILAQLLNWLLRMVDGVLAALKSGYTFRLRKLFGAGTSPQVLKPQLPSVPVGLKDADSEVWYNESA